jgi:hypothetical protein
MWKFPMLEDAFRLAAAPTGDRGPRPAGLSGSGGTAPDLQVGVGRELITTSLYDHSILESILAWRPERGTVALTESFHNG